MMKLFVASSLLAAAMADCTAAAGAALTNPDFAWLFAGTDPDAQKAKLTAICASSVNPERTSFLAALESLRVQCVPQTNGTVGPTELIFNVLEGVMCKKIDATLCGLGVFALFDLTYFLGIQTAATNGIPPSVPDLKTILQTAVREKAICLSDVCNGAIEQAATAFNRAALDATDPSLLADTQTAISFVRRVLNRMRCGCFKSGGGTCYKTANDAYVTAGVLNPAVACDASGQPNACARSFMTCDDLPAPICPNPVACTGVSVSVSFDIKNLNKTCFFEEMTAPGSALGTISKDLQVNALGTIPTDYTCECPLTNADPWLNCACAAKCVDKLLLENDSVKRLAAYSKNKVVQSPNLDALVPIKCKLTSTIKTYGETTEFKLSVQGNGVGALSVGMASLFAMAFALF